MLIPLGGYAGGGCPDWRPALAWIIFGPSLFVVGMAYLVTCIFIADLLGSSMLFPFVFFGVGVPLLMLMEKREGRAERSEFA